jgi:hypothetical protein
MKLRSVDLAPADDKTGPAAEAELIATAIAATGRAEPITLVEFGVSGSRCRYIPSLKEDGSYEEGVVLDMDYWVALPR